MAIIPRSTDPSNGEKIASPGVSTKITVGMVLGVMGLFTIVVSYQLISCPWRKKKTRRVPWNPPIVITSIPARSTPRSFRTRLLSLFKKFRFANATSHNHSPVAPETHPLSQHHEGGLKTLYLSIAKPKASASAAASSSSEPATPAPTLRERRALRSLYLDTKSSSSRKRYPESPSPMSATFKRMGRVFQFDSGSPPTTPTSTPSGWFSPRPPKTPLGRRHYKQLDDSKYSDDAAYGMPRPVDARISPWSPNEGQYPMYSPCSPGYGYGYDPFSASDPGTPLPLYPPPPAYLPEIPLRGQGSTPSSPIRHDAPPATPTQWLHTAPVPVSPIVSSLREQIDGEIVSWDLTPLRGSAKSANAASEGVFVISNDSDEEGSLESVSMYSNNDIEPLTL